MPVFIYEEDVLRKIEEIEGAEWLEKKKIQQSCSFDAFLEEWNKYYRDRADLREAGKNLIFSVDGNGAFYGWRGWNRYVVYYSGEIGFMRDLATEENIRKAEKIGFKIF